jgi:hypothetical protein
MNTVSITMGASTITQLQAEGNALVAFKAASGRDLAAVPLVWFVATQYDTLLSIQCERSYSAYVSSTPIADGNLLQPTWELPIALGQTLTVDTNGAAAITNFGLPGSITISNSSSSPLTTGIGQSVNGTIVPSCAYPLHGSNTQILKPSQQVALMFTTELLTTGYMLKPPTPQRSSSGAIFAFGEIASLLLIDLEQMPNATVNYDIDAGWSWKGDGWASIIPLSSLVKSMILPDEPAAPATAPVLRTAVGRRDDQ